MSRDFGGGDFSVGLVAEKRVEWGDDLCFTPHLLSPKSQL